MDSKTPATAPPGWLAYQSAIRPGRPPTEARTALYGTTPRYVAEGDAHSMSGWVVRDLWTGAALTQPGRRLPVEEKARYFNSEPGLQRLHARAGEAERIAALLKRRTALDAQIAQISHEQTR